MDGIAYRPSNTAFRTGRIEDGTPTKPGGHIYPFLAGATLLVGDVVYISAADTVNKSTTATDHIKAIGVVVGGYRTGGNVLTDNVSPGSVQAAQANEEVLVMVCGKFWVVCDSAIAVGTAIAPSTTTAGRVRAATTPTLASGAVAVTSSAANGAIINGDGFSRIIGHLLQASSANGDIRLALILPR